MELRLNILERINLLNIMQVAGCNIQERKILDNLKVKVEFSNEEIQLADIYLNKDTPYDKSMDFEKGIVIIEIEINTLKRIVNDFAEANKCVNDLNKSLFYKIDDLNVV